MHDGCDLWEKKKVIFSIEIHTNKGPGPVLQVKWVFIKVKCLDMHNKFFDLLIYMTFLFVSTGSVIIG